MKKTIIFLLSLFAISCASTTKQYLASQPVEIETSQLGDYWVATNKEFKFQVPTKKVPQQATNGHVKVRFLIDSNGNVFNPEIVESSPEGAWDYSGIKASLKQKYVPAKQNASLKPVYVTQTITFNFGAQPTK